MGTPLDLIREGIKANNMDMVAEGFKSLTGEYVEAEQIDYSLDVVMNNIRREIKKLLSKGKGQGVEQGAGSEAAQETVQENSQEEKPTKKKKRRGRPRKKKSKVEVDEEKLREKGFKQEKMFDGEESGESKGSDTNGSDVENIGDDESNATVGEVLGDLFPFTQTNTPRPPPKKLKIKCVKCGEVFESKVRCSYCEKCIGSFG